MTPDEAHSLIHQEAIGDESLLVHARFGPRIEPGRVNRLIEAVRVLHHELRGQATLERTLATELYFLGSLVLRDLEAQREVEQELLESVVNLVGAIDYLFLDSELD